MNLFIGPSKIRELGTFTGTPIRGGAVIKRLAGKVYSEKQIDSFIKKGILALDDDFQISDEYFMILPKRDYYLNHSCDPKCGIRGTSTLVAIRDIKAGEEITFDYSTVTGISVNGSQYPNEKWKMVCNCNCKNCRKEISYIGSLQKPQLTYYSQLNALPDFIKSQIILM